jgi:hypothetical protein
MTERILLAIRALLWKWRYQETRNSSLLMDWCPENIRWLLSFPVCLVLGHLGMTTKSYKGKDIYRCHRCLGTWLS